MKNLKTHIVNHTRIHLLNECEYFKRIKPKLGLLNTGEADVWTYVISAVWDSVENSINVTHNYERVGLDCWIGSVK